MKKSYLRKALAGISYFALFASVNILLYPCSTFLLRNGRTLLVGHNLDERTHIPGLVYINKRHVTKTAVSWASLVSGKPDTTPPLTWTSKYASITFNPFGREFPDDGMNEAGLFIGEMTLTESIFPVDPEKPRIFMSLWMQSLLDTCESVSQVIASAAAIDIDGWGWHFFTADRNGDTASLEFLEGKLVVHTGETMPVPVLCNTVYEQEIQNLEPQKKKIAKDPGFLEGQEVARFVQAAEIIDRFPDSSKPPVEYAFDILKRLERGGTQWSFVCDLKNQRAWFKTARSAKVKQVDMKDFPLGCDLPPKFLDIHSDLEGDASAYFQAYSLEANKTFARQALDAILAISPQFDKMVTLQGGTMNGLLERFASYPEKLECRK